MGKESEVDTTGRELEAVRRLTREVVEEIRGRSPFAKEEPPSVDKVLNYKNLFDRWLRLHELERKLWSRIGAGDATTEVRSSRKTAPSGEQHTK